MAALTRYHRVVRVPRSVFFDLDGTLTNPRAGIVRCIQHAFERLGHVAPAERDLLSWIGPPLYDSFRARLGAAQADSALAHYRERFATVGMYENALYEGVKLALKQLINKSFSLYIVTSKPTVFAAAIARHFGIAEFFAAIYGSELDGALSDKRALIAHVLRQEQLDSNDVTMVGDRLHDMHGGQHNGVRTVGVLWGYGSRDELADADGLCHAVDDLPAMLDDYRQSQRSP